MSNTFDLSNAFYVSMEEKEAYVGGEYEENIMKDLYTHLQQSNQYISFANIEDYIEIKDRPKNKR